MANLNQVQLIGRLGRDPEIAYTQSGTAKCRLSVGTDYAWTDKQSGERKVETEWSRVIVWGPLAEHCNQFLAKGRLVFVHGRLKTSSYDDKDGIKRYSTDVIGDQVQFLDRPDSSSQGGQEASSAGQQASKPVTQNAKKQEESRSKAPARGSTNATRPAQTQRTTERDYAGADEYDNDDIPFEVGP